MKFLRKPYLAIFLSVLMLATSCSQYENDTENFSDRIEKEDFNRMEKEDFARNHIDISSKILDLIKSEKNINSEYILSITENDNYSFSQLNDIYKEANVVESEKLAGFVIDLFENSKAFIQSNPNLSKVDLENLLITEIDNQLNNSKAWRLQRKL